MRCWVLLAALGGLAACSDDRGGRNAADVDLTGKSLLLISIDTLRADRLGAYGYDRDTSPALDALADEGVLFEELYSNSPKTASAHMSLFTSMYPSAHKVRNQSARLNLSSPVLAKNRTTLPQVLNQNGYYTAGIAGGGNLNPDMGFKRGFMGRFESALEDVSRLVDRAKTRMTEASRSGQPGFVFLHTYQVHGPYLPPREFMERFAPQPVSQLGPRVMAYVDLPFKQQWSVMNKGDQPYWGGKEDFGPEEAAYLSDLYDAEIAYTDAELGKLFDWMRSQELLDDWIVVVTADHGEEFLEHGDFEHDQLFREHLHVPLIVRLPGGRLGGGRVAGLASLIDVAPTLVELLGLPEPATFAGQSLVPAMLTGRTANRPVLAERVMFPDDYKATLRSDRSAVTFHATQQQLHAFDLLDDPDELVDVFDGAAFAQEDGARLLEMLKTTFQIRDELDRVDAGGTLTVDTQEQLEALMALGYVDGGGDDGEIPAGTPLESWPEEHR